MSNANEQGSTELKLNGLFVFKVGMSAIYGDSGEMIPVTVLKYENTFVSQIKTEATDGYEAVQIAIKPRRAKNSTQAHRGHVKGTAAEGGVEFLKEVRQAPPAGLAVGQTVSINSLAKGDVVSLTARSKGRGFMGSVKRFGFAGGPASHGSKFHRQPGSSGNRTWPGRVMPGKRFPGHMGFENVTLKNVEVVDVIPEENVLLVKGSVPGGTNTLVCLLKAART